MKPYILCANRVIPYFIIILNSEGMKVIILHIIHYNFSLLLLDQINQ